jgi:hypothetical protein
MEQGKFTEAKEIYRKAHMGLQPSNIKDALLALMHFAKACVALGDEENNWEATYAYNYALQTFATTRGPHHPLTLAAKVKLADAFRQQKKYDRANGLIRSAIDKYAELKLSPKSTTTIEKFEAKLTLAHLMFDQMQDTKYTESIQWNEVEQNIQEARNGLAGVLEENDMLSLDASALLGELYIASSDAEKREKGEAMLRKALDSCCEKFTAAHPTTMRIIECLIQYLINGDADRKEEVKRLLGMKRDQLRKARGPDYAAMILRMTNPIRMKRELPDS